MEKKERNPRHLTAADVKVGVLRVDAQGVKLRVWPKPERIRSILDELYSPEGWYMSLSNMAGKVCCNLCLSHLTEEKSVKTLGRAAICPSEYKMRVDQSRNEMDGAFIMCASLMGVGDSVMQLPSILFRNDEVQINPVPDASGKRIVRYDLADTLTPTNLVYDASGHIVEVDFTRRNGGVIKWQKR